MAAPDKSAEDYILSRNFHASARLSLQNWVWNTSIGYLLHPSIPIPATGLRIADIGAGNACWLIELARKLPSACILDGFDISPSQFPAKEYLPRNISLHIADAFAEAPESLLGKYDVVHVRSLTLVVKGGDPKPLLRILKRMLKPGGYIQWDEWDIETVAVHAPNPSISAEKARRYTEKWRAAVVAMGVDVSWIPNLATHFEDLSLDVIAAERKTLPDDLRKAFTDDALMGMEDMAYVSLAKGGLPGPLGSVEEWREAFGGLVEETQRGVSLQVDMLVVVGRWDGNGGEGR